MAAFVLSGAWWVQQAWSLGVMSPHSDNETWIVAAGDAVLSKRADGGLSPIDRLVYCLWVADYGMRNAGDLDTARDVYPDFHREAANLARDLGLGYVLESFSLPTEALQGQYFERFDRICDEIKIAEAGASSDPSHRNGFW